MRPALLIATSLAALLTTSAHATVQVAIDLTHQRMHVDGNEGTYDWPISSARSGFYTPGGSYAPTHLELLHYSHKYHMSPMPHAIFFRGGYAIHGTYAMESLGRPASHGCVRLSPGNAATLYAMVKAEGARISISGAPPASRPFYARAERDPTRSTDADALSRLAPPSSESTADQNFGDASYARRRLARRPYAGYGYGDAQGTGYQSTPQRPGYRPGYTYAPSYLSAPQIFGGSPSQQTPLLPFFGE